MAKASKGFDKKNWSSSLEPSRDPTIDLEDIVESYDILGGTFKIVFLWVRCSSPYFDPPLGGYSFDFLLKFKSKRHVETGNKVLAGSISTYIVPDQYYKAGQSDSTLESYNPFKEHQN